MDGTIQFLPWDSGTFGYRVGRARFSAPPPPDAIRSLREEALLGRFRLVYCVWPGPSGAGVDGLSFVSVHGDFSFPLSENGSAPAPAIAISPCTELDDSLLQLAFESGLHSRFRQDSGFRRGEFETLYRLWLEKDIRAEQGGCFVAGSPGRPDGLLTLGPSGDSGILQIGLLAVDARVRRRGVAGNLLAFAKKRAAEQGFRQIAVRTQDGNAAAKALYLSAGFSLVGMETVGHLWLPGRDS